MGEGLRKEWKIIIQVLLAEEEEKGFNERPFAPGILLITSDFIEHR